MRGLHASLIFLQGVPVVVGVVLAAWVAYYLRAAVVELRAIRDNLDWLNDRVEQSTRSTPESGGTGAVIHSPH
jgi:hypothetical protein